MGNGWWLILAVAGLWWLFFGRKRDAKRGARKSAVTLRAQQQAIESHSSSGNLARTISFESTVDLPSPPTERRKSRGPSTKNSPTTRWVRQGESIEIQGISIIGGMVYVGVSKSGYDDYNYDRSRAHVVCLDLSIAKKRTDLSGDTMGYWCSYSDISPQARRAYLLWLADGRRNPDAGIGHVFLFFYGLEHRLFVEQAWQDASAISNEVEQLLAVYGENHSFSQYADTFLRTVAIIQGNVATNPDVKVRSGIYGELPVDLRFALGRRLTEGPLTADWLLAWYLGLNGLNLRTPARRCPEEFRQLFEILFLAKFPNGMKLRLPKKRLQMTYQPASGAPQARITGEFQQWPDPAALTAPLKAAEKLATQSIDALDQYSRFLGRNPESRDSLAAYSLLPAVMRNLDPKKHDSIRSELHELAPTGAGVVSVARLLELARIPHDKNKKPATKLLQSLSTGLAAVDFAMEPDVRFGGRVGSLTTEVIVFRAVGGAPVDHARQEYAAARSLLEIAAVAATIDDANAVTGLQIVQHEIERLPGLLDAERLRLFAYLASFRRVGPNPKTVLQKLASRASAERERIARVALSTIAADRKIAADEVRFAERLYKALDLPTERVHTDLHSLAANVTHDPDLPPIIANVERPQGGVPVTPPFGDKALSNEVDAGAPIVATSIKSNHQALERKRKETQAVQQLLSTVFEDEDATDVPEITPLAKPESSSINRFHGLDAEHKDLIEFIIAANGQLDRADFEAAATQHGLFADGALETINDWAIDYFEEPLIEDSDPISIPADLLEQLQKVA